MPDIWRNDVQQNWLEQTNSARTSEQKRDANLWLLDVSEVIGKAGVCGLALDATDDEVRAAARDACENLYELALQCDASNFASIRAAAVAQCDRHGITPPEAKLSDEAALLRMLDGDWRVRRVRAAHGRAIEAQTIELGRVWRKREAFCSNLTLERRRQQRARNLAALESRVAINQHGEEFLLAELAEAGTSDPENRVAELLTRIKGFEDEAKRRMDEGLFITLTCPSRMHARLQTGYANPKYDGTTPREAQEHLSKSWARARAALARRGVKVYGVRVCEPHHDATPHWHMLTFCRQAQGVVVMDVLRRYFLLNHDPQEQGASLHRVKAEALDWAKGSAVGYLVKYVCKNIHGATMPDDDDETGMSGEKRAERVEAWAACWGIRQFQVFGGPAVGVWRELRRIGTDADHAPEIEEIRQHADAGKWAEFVQAMGGVLKKRAEMPIVLAKTDLGYAWSASEQSPYPKQNRFGEPCTKTTYGVQDCNGRVVVITRTLDWKVGSGSDAARNRAKQRQEARRRPLPDSGKISTPWTCVTNCTDHSSMCQAPPNHSIQQRGAPNLSGRRQDEIHTSIS